jgi:hypothetical protein
MRDWKDRLGIFASAVCAIHCAATPILLATLPTLKLTEWMADPLFHQGFAVACCLLVAIAIVPMAWRFRDLRLFSLASSGLGLILMAAFFMPESCCSTTDSSELSELHAGHDHADGNHGHRHTDEELASVASESSSTLLVAGMGLAQPWMTPLGGLLLILAHGLNMKRRWTPSCSSVRCCNALHDHEHVVKIVHCDATDARDAANLARAS